MTPLEERHSRARDLVQGYGPLMGGEIILESGGGRHAHVNPSNGRVQAELWLAGELEVDKAVRDARDALSAWRAVPPNEKARILARFADLIEADQEALDMITAIECGTPCRPGSGGAFAVNWIRYFAGWCDKIEGEVVKSTTLPGFNYVLGEPYGVVAALFTWNGPIGGLGMKVAPALASGNAVVIKTPELASFGALRACKLAARAGLPPGLISVLPGAAEVGAALVRHPGVDKISFTGGPVAAKHVMASAAQTLRPLALELGGKSANIVFSDADLRTVLPSAVLTSIVMLSGQGCVFPTRLIVHDSLYDEVVQGIADLVTRIRVGDPLDPSADMGPVISEAACDRILGVIDQARESRSGRLVCGGARCSGDLAHGYFVEPTVFSDVDPASDLARNEIFGPVLSVMRFAADSHAVALANDSEFGLGAYLHTRDLERAHRAAAALDVGCVYVNTSTPHMSPTAPFGGVKNSGFGREGGRAGLDEFLRRKSVFISMG